MTNIIQFVPRARSEASANLAEFIRLAKEELTAFSGSGGWDNNRWEHNGSVIVFATKRAPVSIHEFSPMAEPFVQFAKAYVRYCYSHRPTKRLDYMSQALRCIEAGLIAACGSASIQLLTPAAMDVCADQCRNFYGTEDSRYHTGRHIKTIFDFIRDMHLVPSLPPWRSPFKKPTTLTEDLGPKGQAHRESKLPTDDAMLRLGDLFSRADDAESRYFSSILVLLMAAPSRISEVFHLPIDCVQWEEDDQGTPQMYLRWWAAKGKGQTKKWVLPAMQDVIQEAVRRLIEIGRPAREAARLAFEESGKSAGYVDVPVDDLDRPLTPYEFCAAVGFLYANASRSPGTLPKSIVGQFNTDLQSLLQQGMPSLRRLAPVLLEKYKTPSWPYVDSTRRLRVWDALVLHRENEFNASSAVKEFSWRLPTTNDVNERLDPSGGKSLFEKHGLTVPDGPSIKMTTHQIRHWLSTKSERAGMDDFTLAQWAGRAKVRDNHHYDHRTPEERSEAASELLQVEKPPLLERFKHRQPVTYEELGVNRLGTAKATLYGMCVHDYAMAPCQKQRECMTCKEHVCIKGDHVTLDRIKLLEEQTKALLVSAQRAHEAGDFGADRWVDNHRWKHAHVITMREMLERADIPEGAVLRIPDGYDPSPIRRTLMEIGIDEGIELAVLAPRQFTQGED